MFSLVALPVLLRLSTVMLLRTLAICLTILGSIVALLRIAASEGSHASASSGSAVGQRGVAADEPVLLGGKPRGTPCLGVLDLSSNQLYPSHHPLDGCSHRRFSRSGSNARRKKATCLDCGRVFWG